VRFFLWKVLLRYPSRTYDIDVVMKRLRLVLLLIDWRRKAPIKRLTNEDLNELQSQQLFSSTSIVEKTDRSSVSGSTPRDVLPHCFTRLSVTSVHSNTINNAMSATTSIMTSTSGTHHIR
jgi:hypothetical protein